MRIVSGTLKGRRFNPPKNLDVRPTTDLAKESLFNILLGYIDFEEASVIDLFAGTGNISFEFISRGAPEVLSVDKNGKCIRYIKETTELLGLKGLKAIRDDVFRFIKFHKKSYDLVFADPPYNLQGLDTLPQLVFNSYLMHKETLFILEHPDDYSFKQVPGFIETRKYSRVNFSFFRKQDL